MIYNLGEENEEECQYLYLFVFGMDSFLQSFQLLKDQKWGRAEDFKFPIPPTKQL